MRKPTRAAIYALAGAVAAVLAAAAPAQQNEDTGSDATPTTVREIYVPFQNLNVLLEGETERVFLTREEYQALLAKAKEEPGEDPPVSAVILSAAYDVQLEEGRAIIQGVLEVEVLDDGLHALPLELGGVGVRQAALDDAPASLGQGPDRRLRLFVGGPGVRRLKLEMVAPLVTAAAQQSLDIQLPTPAATRMSVTAPGNVEVKSGATVLSRAVNQQAGVTQMELALPRGAMTLVMTLNNRLLLAQRVVVARSVLVDEVTSAYERLHATVSLAVLRGAADRFRFGLPAGFEVTDAVSPLLARWEVVRDGDRNVLEVKLREAVSETVVLTVSALRTPARLDNWRLPRLEPLDVEGQVAVVGLLVEDQLIVDAIEPERLIPVDNEVLQQALPASVFQAEPGAPRVRSFAAYYAPQAEYQLSARFNRPPRQLKVTTNLLLLIDEGRQEVRGGFALMPDVQELFAVDFAVPAGWRVDEVTLADGTALPLEEYPRERQGTRVHVVLPQPLAPGAEQNLYFHAESVPEGWLDAWTALPVDFPAFAVLGATRDVGAIAVQPLDDLIVRPDVLSALIPLDEREKGNFGLAEVATSLAYRYESQPYAATLEVSRKVPRLTARTYSFLVVRPEGITAHYEIMYDVQEARTRQLSFVLPADTPSELSLRGLDGVVIKEYFSEQLDGERRWIALLAESRRGAVRLAVDFQDRLDEEQPQGLPLPIVRADAVQYQSGVVTVEGSAELDIQVVQSPRRVDIGELVDAEYQPGRRLLGVFEFVGDRPDVTIDVFRRPGYGLPPAIVQRAELVTLIAPSGAPSGLSQTAARYQLRTKATYLEVELPAGATLWSALLDGQPAAPQRDGTRLLLSLPARSDAAAVDLQIVYEAAVDPVALIGSIEVLAPKLYLRSVADARSNTDADADADADADVQRQEVPVADVLWHLQLPEGYHMVRSRGTVFAGKARQRRSPAVTALGVMYELLGGIRPPLGALYSAREAARRPSSGPSRGLMSGLEEASSNEAALPSGEMAAGDVVTADSAAATRMNQLDSADMPARKPASPAVPPPPVKEAEGQIAVPSDEVDLAPPPGQDVEKAESAKKKSRLWALEGVRSLTIDVPTQQTGEQVSFQSLGVDPRLRATLANQSRLDLLAWGAALLVALIGLAITRRPRRVKVRLVVSVLLGALLLAQFMRMFGWSDELAKTLDYVFFAGCLLVAYYLAAAAVRWLASRAGRRGSGGRAAAAVMGLALLAGSAAHAQEPVDEITQLLLPLLEPGPPVQLPADAVIIPYDAEDADGVGKAEKLLVPYARYVELWNRAYPDQKLLVAAPPAPYALAGAAFTATLAGDEYLLVEGYLDLDVYLDEPVSVPLPLSGGVLARATVDGQPARLRSVALQAAEAPNAPVSQRAQQVQARPMPEPPPGPLTVLELSGKGRRRLELAVRLRLERQGGWRIASGRLPAAPATALTLRVPDARTEVRLQGPADRGSYETTDDDEQIETALPPDGALRVRWRPKVAQADADQSLTATSYAVLDVQEDALSLAWRTTLAFRGGQRDAFTLSVPGEYLVEKVLGENVRGWSAEQREGSVRLQVTLLKPASGQETFALQLARRGTIGQGELAEFAAPVVTIPDAALHQGQLTIRRSPILELRTVVADGLARIDASDEAAAIAARGASPLPPRLFQAYRFVASDYRLRLAAAEIVAKTSADLQTVVGVSERKVTFASRIMLRVQDRPIYRLRIVTPAEYELEPPELTPSCDFEWSVVDNGDRRELTAYFAAGRQGELSLLLRGAAAKDPAANSVAVPQLEVLDAVRQQGDLVVQSDPGYDIRAQNLVKCETVLLGRVRNWFQNDPRSPARLALHYNSPGYAAQLRASPLQPNVRAYTITNVKVTGRAIQETVLLNFHIENAGIRELSFVVPAALRQARIKAAMLRQKTITPLSEQADADVRVRLQLQDEVIGDYVVVVENDRLLTGGIHQVPIPVVETGRTDQRYLSLENVGEDELVVEQQPGLDPLSRRQTAWRRLAEALGGNVTTAFLVRQDAADPQLAFNVKDRTAVETAGARIGFAKATVSLDSNGAYRVAQLYQLDNKTEQFLIVELPAGAWLWTALVAGDPVKPTEVPGGASPRQVRIPLVKTAAGDLDYPVTLKYGGRLPAGSWQQVRFPLMKTINVNVELSQVELYLPETHSWFRFGGTMRQVFDENDLLAGYLSYQTKQIQQLQQTATLGNLFSQVRAASNLKQLGQDLRSYNSTKLGRQSRLSRELQLELAANNAALSQAEQQLQVDSLIGGAEVTIDNRDRLNEFFHMQDTIRAKNVITDAGLNFRTQPRMPGSQEEIDGRFDRAWLTRNSLRTLPPDQAKSDSRVQLQLGVREEEGVAGKRLTKAGAKGLPKAPEVARGRDKEKLRSLEKKIEPSFAQQPAPESSRDQAQRYYERLSEQQLNEQSEQQQSQLLGERVAGPAQQGLFSDGEAPGRQSAGVAAVDDTGRRDMTAAAPSTPYVSLDVQIPLRGRRYLFTTPRGEVEITARRIDRSMIEGLVNIAAILAGAAVLWLMYRMLLVVLRWSQTRLGATALVLLGLLSLLTGIFVIAGLVAVAVGTVLWLRRLRFLRRSAEGA